MKPLGLYLHIPFCKNKCAYCDFYSLPATKEVQDTYLSALQRELAHWQTAARDYVVDSVYFGGGTPSWFGAERLSALLECLKANYSLSPDCEITVEANPDSLSPSALQLLSASGVNRLSLGVQSSAEGELQQAGRLHSFAQAVQAVHWARQAGFSNLSLDLIYGLPGQSLAQWQRNVEAALALQPEQLSCYGLKLEPGTPFWQERERLVLPDEDAQAEAYLWLCQRLEQEGFVHNEISNFARAGYASRHNLKYWRMEEYLGFGPSAHSDFAGRRFGYARDLAAYLRGCCPLSEEYRPSPQERLEEYLMLSLRTGEGLCREDYARYGGQRWTAVEQQLQLLSRHELMQQQGRFWHCTPRGFLVSNAIIALLQQANAGE